jgi:hypothetical protein
MQLRSTVAIFAATMLVANAAPSWATGGGVECVIHDWAVPPGTWTGSGDVDPTPLLMTATTRWQFHLDHCSLSAGVCDFFGSGSRTFQNGAERIEWYPTNTQPTISAVGNAVTYSFMMRDAFVPIQGQPRFEDMDWTLTAQLPAAPPDSPSAADLAQATSISVAIDHWVDNTFFIIHWGGTATDTQFVSCTPVLAGLAVDDVAQAEGSGGGTTPFVFTVSRSHNADAVSVTAATMDGSAEAGTDYTSVGPVVLDFPAGGTLSQTVTVDVAADDAVELNENFTLELSNAVNASIADGTGDGTIQNDDTPAELTIDDVPQTEGSGGGTTIQAFTVSRSHNLETVSVQAQSVDGTATAGSDYTGVGPTTLNFPAGGVLAQEVAISVAADDLVELDEGYTVELSGAVNATIVDGVGDGTIVNDDAATISIDSASQPEGSGGGTVPFVFTVTLDAAVDTGVAVDFDSADGTAEDESGDGDYAAAQGTVQFAAGAGGSEGVTIDVAADDRPERDEDFFVDLSNVAADGRDVTLAVDQGTATLLDDDDACPGLTVYRQPWDSPPDVRGHLATSGPEATFENVVDGGGTTVPLPPGQVSGLRAWGIGRDGGLPCPLDPAVPFDLIFAADAAGAPGAVLAQRAGVTPAITSVAPDVFQIDLFFAPFDAGGVSWLSIQRAESAGCAFEWLAEDLVGTYDDLVFTPPGPAPDDAYFCLGDPLIFADGFESGDTSAWSATVP